MGVLDGCRLRFVLKSRNGARERPTYIVEAVPTNGRAAASVVLGEVEAIRISTDRQAGRLRIPGRGRRGWRAAVTMDEAIAAGSRGGCELGGGWGKFGAIRLGWIGRDFDTRREAAELLVRWHDHPELRRPEAERD